MTGQETALNQPIPVPTRRPTLLARTISRAFAAYPAERGRWRLGQWLSPWLVARLDTGAWIRVSGVSDFEWLALRGRTGGEARTVAAFCDLVTAGSTVIDVGANIGFYSLAAALLAGRSGRVIAFEPNPRAARRLRENIALNGLTTVAVIQGAAGAAPGRLTFHLAPDSEASSLYAVDPDGSTEIVVTVTTIDGYLTEAGIARVDVLKMDAEGAEVDVLLGANALLARPDAPVIVLEANPVTLRAANRSVAELRSVLERQGYTISLLQQMRWQGEVVENWLARK